MKAYRYVVALWLCVLARPGFADILWDVDSLRQDASARNLSSITLVSNSGGQFGTMSRAYIDMLADIRNRIGQQAGLYPKFLITSSNDVNAYATVRNGQAVIGFTLPMLRALGNDRDAIAAIVGHEIAHLAHSHSLEKAVVSGLFEVLAELAGAAIDAKTSSRGYGGVLAKSMVDFGAKSGTAAFSREAEIEADTSGTRYMIAAGFNPDGALRVHSDVIHKESYTFLSTHPASPARLQAIQQVIADSRASRQTIASAPPAQVAKPASNSVDKSVPPVSQHSRSTWAPVPDESKNSDMPIPNQVGVVLTLKQRYGYLIFSGTTPNWLADSTQLEIVSAGGGRIPARVSRGIDGYYSAVVEGAMHAIAVGDRVVLRKVQ